jgi:hypothetical protein
LSLQEFRDFCNPAQFWCDNRPKIGGGTFDRFEKTQFVKIVGNDLKGSRMLPPYVPRHWLELKSTSTKDQKPDQPA